MAWKIVRFFPQGDGYGAKVVTYADNIEDLELDGKMEGLFEMDDDTFYVLEMKHRVTGEKHLSFWNSADAIREEYDFPEELFSTGAYRDEDDITGGWDVRLVEISQF